MSNSVKLKELMAPGVRMWKSTLKDLYKELLDLTLKISNIENAINKYENTDECLDPETFQKILDKPRELNND